MSPLLSVITITYNDLDGFIKTYASVMPQLTASVEWIVKDGGSRPAVLQEINRLLSCTDCVFLSSADSGVYGAMNTALPVVNGDWVVFMNGGDEFASANTISQILSLILTKKLDPFVSYLLAGGTQFVPPSGQCIYKAPRCIAQCSGINSYRMAAFHQSQIYSRSIFEKQRFREALSVSADHAFFWDAINRGTQLLCLDFPVSRFYSGGISSQRMLRSCLDVGYSIYAIQGHMNLVGLLAFLKRLCVSCIRFF